jgi:nicotinate-nucleotide pyrophosphorylase (carboxylating)
MHHPILPHDRGSELWVDHLPTEKLEASIKRWVTTLMHEEGITTPLARDEDTVNATIFTKDEGVVAGITVANYLLKEWLPNTKWEWTIGDGGIVNAGKVLLTLEGGKEQILAAERIILNIIGRLSGIATNTAEWVQRARPVRVASTRKVHWGMLDKWAVALGGGLTHRLTRKDAKMIKENDLASMVRDGEKRPHAVSRIVSELDVESLGAFGVLEVKTIDEAIAAAEAWNERMGAEKGNEKLTVMLDNMPPEKAKEVVLDLDTRNFRNYVIIEVSGGITFDELPVWNELEVDVISSSALHRGVKPLDVSMLFDGA